MRLVTTFTISMIGLVALAALTDAAPKRNAWKRDVPALPGRKSRSSRPTSPEANRKISVYGISKDTTEKQIKEYFSKYGQIVSVKLITEGKTGSANVVFFDLQTLQKVFAIGTHEINGHSVTVHRRGHGGGGGGYGANGGGGYGANGGGYGQVAAPGYGPVGAGGYGQGGGYGVGYGHMLGR